MVVLYILLAVVVLLFMVLIHETGHYVAGRILKFKIEEFSIGFGKAIFSRTNKRGEKISLRIFPLGGYCAFAGEDGEKEGIKKEDTFAAQKPWKRIIVFLAGVTFNFLTAILFSFILLVSVGYDIVELRSYQTLQNVVSYEVSEEYDPAVNNLQDGDVVFYVNGTKIDFAYSYSFPDLVTMERNKLNAYLNAEENKNNPQAFKNYEPVTLTVRRDGKMQDVDVYFIKVEQLAFDSNGNPIWKRDKDGNYLDKDGNITTDENLRVQATKIGYSLGGNIDESGEVAAVQILNFGSYRHSFVEALARCVPMAFGFAWVVLKSLWLLITFQLPISQIGGPITTIAEIASVTQANMANLLVLIPLISANLAVFNLLPIPALDGAHVIFTLIEWIRRKPIKPEIENMIHSIGLLVLLGFVILVDILHFVL